MNVESLISLEYPRVNPYEGVNVIENSLVQSRFMVVSDEESNYYGILLPSDLLTKPHKLVIDCLTEKPRIDSEQDIRSVFDFMVSRKHTVLPVFKDESFIGIISARKVAKIIKAYTEKLSDIIIENTAEIDHFKKEALISEKLKDSFLRNVNHEIRTPLTSIIGFSALLISDGKTEKEKSDYVEIIEQSSNRFLKVMENIINLSRIQAGDRFVTAVNESTISELMRELYLYYKEHKRKLYKDHLGFKYTYQITDDKAYSLDFLKIKQILGYLLDNAFKFTNAGGIELGCISVSDNELKFFVKDTGVGIPPEKIEYIFDTFNKVSINKECFDEGLGLGLAIARKLVLSMGAQITVESEMGKGSCFYVLIPVS